MELVTLKSLRTNDVTLLPLMQLANIYVNETAKRNGHTARAYRKALTYLFEFLGEKHPVLALTLADATRGELDAFVKWRERVEKPSSAALRIAAVKAFLSWVEDHVPGYVSPARRVRPPAVERGSFKAVAPEDIELLCRAAFSVGPNVFIRARSGCLVSLIYRAGIRADEARNLTIGQLDGDWLRRVKCKGRRYRDVYLTSTLRRLIDEYLTARDIQLRMWGVEDSPAAPLFPTHLRGAIRALSYKTLWRAVATASDLAGIKHVNPHALRHSFAHGLIDQTNDIRLVAQALGHTDVKITMRYTERTPTKLANAIERAIG